MNLAGKGSIDRSFKSSAVLSLLKPWCFLVLILNSVLLIESGISLRMKLKEGLPISSLLSSVEIRFPLIVEYCSF